MGLKDTELRNRFAYVDSFGRLYFDRCESPAAHLVVESPPDEDRRRCCTSIEDLLPTDCLGRRGTWRVKIEFVPEAQDEADLPFETRTCRLCNGESIAPWPPGSTGSGPTHHTCHPGEERKS